MKSLLCYDFPSNVSLHWGLWLMHGWGKRPCSDLQEQRWRCCDTTWVEVRDCTCLSSTWPTYLGPSIVRLWFIPLEVTKGRQSVVLNTNKTMESPCVRAQQPAQHRKGGWPGWALWGQGVSYHLFSIGSGRKDSNFYRNSLPLLMVWGPRLPGTPQNTKCYLYNAMLLRLIWQPGRCSLLFPVLPKQRTPFDFLCLGSVVITHVQLNLYIWFYLMEVYFEILLLQCNVKAPSNKIK